MSLRLDATTYPFIAVLLMGTDNNRVRSSVSVLEKHDTQNAISSSQDDCH